MLNTNDDLFEFLYQGHRAWPGELGLPEHIIPEEVPGGLRRAYSAIGLLTRRESQFNPGSQRRRPLGTQDALVEPEELKLENGLLRIVYENQGVWSYFVPPGEDDPEVFSDIRGGKPAPIGCRLSDFLITFCLQETIMSGATKLAVTIEGDEDRYLQIASAPLWLGGKWVDGNVYHEFYADPGGELLCMKCHSMTFFAFRQLAGQPCPPRCFRYHVAPDGSLELSCYDADERDMAERPFGYREKQRC
jgi:hypothetical protein